MLSVFRKYAEKRKYGAKKGDIFKIKDINSYKGAVFTISRYENGTRVEKNIHFDSLNLENGTIITCLGKGGGGHPKFYISFGDAWRGIAISMTFKADGKPESYGIERYTGAKLRLTNPVHVHQHR